MTPQWIAILASVWAVAVTAIATIYPLQQRKRIATLQRQLATALGIIGERDDMLREYDERNKRLHRDVRRMQDRLPHLAADDPAVDEDVTRPYVREPIADWERKFLEEKAARELGYTTRGRTSCDEYYL